MNGFTQPRDADGRFVNLDGSGPRPLGDVLRWALVDKVAGRRRRAPARADVPSVRADPAALRTPPAAGAGARLTWLGHASWLVQLGGRSFVVDPVLGPHVSYVVPRNAGPALRVEELPPVEAALVTHAHYDHLDRPTLRALGAPVVAGLGTGRLLPCRELGWWQAAAFGDVTVTFVPAQHWSRRHVRDANRALWGGFVLSAPGVAVYHAGDTALFDGFEEIGRRFQLDAALLPVGAYDPEWFMGSQHMNPEEAVEAFARLCAKQLLAMHWGTFKLTDEPLDEPPRRLEAERVRRGLPAETVRALAIGETVTVGAG